MAAGSQRVLPPELQSPLQEGAVTTSTALTEHLALYTCGSPLLGRRTAWPALHSALPHTWTLVNCTVPYCNVQHCIALYCTALYCTVLHCTVLYFTAMYFTELYYLSKGN